MNLEQDVAMLKSQVSTMLVVLQIVNQVQETLLPIFLRRPSTRRMMNKFSKKMEDRSKKAERPPEPVEVSRIFVFLPCSRLAADRS